MGFYVPDLGPLKDLVAHHDAIPIALASLAPFLVRVTDQEVESSKFVVGGVYFHVVDGRVGYVGRSSNVKQRTRQHHINGRVDRNVTIWVLPCDDNLQGEYEDAFVNYGGFTDLRNRALTRGNLPRDVAHAVAIGRLIPREAVDFAISRSLREKNVDRERFLT